MLNDSDKTEHEVQNEILHALNKEPGFFFWRCQSTGIPQPDGTWRRKVGFDIRGVSDVLGIQAETGRFIAIEVKKPGSTLSDVSKYQKAFLGKIHRMGGYSCWVTSVEAALKFIYFVRNGQYDENRKGESSPLHREEESSL